MLPHPCRESADQFSFSDPATEEAKPEDPSPPRAMEYGKWAERIKGKYNYFGRPEDVKFGPWSRKSSAGGTPPPPPPPELRKAGKPPAARSAEISPAGSRGSDGDSHIGNGSRATSIAKYRQEMLDLVRDMPESSYELSLIDMVESPKVTEKAMETTAEEEEDSKKKKKEKKMKKGIMRRVSRSESLDSGGLMLKMFIPRMPVVLGGKRQAFSKSGKVSPSKPSSADGDREGERGRRREFGERVSSTTSSRSSRNSNSSSSTTSSSRNGASVSSRLIGSCYPFAHRGKSMGVDD